MRASRIESAGVGEREAIPVEVVILGSLPISTALDVRRPNDGLDLALAVELLEMPAALGHDRVWHDRPFRAFPRMRSDARGYP